MAILSHVFPDTPPHQLDSWQMDIVTTPVTPAQARSPCPICHLPMTAQSKITQRRARRVAFPQQVWRLGERGTLPCFTTGLRDNDDAVEAGIPPPRSRRPTIGNWYGIADENRMPATLAKEVPA